MIEEPGSLAEKTARNRVGRGAAQTKPLVAAELSTRSQCSLATAIKQDAAQFMARMQQVGPGNVLSTPKMCNALLSSAFPFPREIWGALAAQHLAGVYSSQMGAAATKVGRKPPERGAVAYARQAMQLYLRYA